MACRRQVASRKKSSQAKRRPAFRKAFRFRNRIFPCRVSGKRILSMVWQPNLSQVCGAAMFSTILHECRAAPPFGLSPKRGQKRPCPIHPAASINEPPAPHRERQVAAKGGMLQTRSRPQSCGFRPPVLAAIAKRRCAPGVGQPTCGAPDAAEPVEQKPLPPYAAGVRKSAFFR